MDQSTPISRLQNDGDADVVNNILNKYNNMQNNNGGASNIEQLEQKFENRDFNKEIFDGRNDPTPYKEHYAKEKERIERFQNPVPDGDGDADGDDMEQQYEEYEEYEVIELPLWKRVLNELRTPIFIFLIILVLFNAPFDKLYITYLPFFGNKYNECNTKGFLIKALLVALISYVCIRFIKFNS